MEGAVALEEQQIPAVGEVLARALQEDPLPAFVLPEPAERIAAFSVVNATLARFGHLFGEAVVTPGTVTGAAVWTPPGVDVTPERAQAAGFHRSFEALGEGLERFGRVMDSLSGLEKPPEHWYLMVVGVEPERQRQGIGRALLQPLLAQADRTQLPVYLETFQPTNLPFYEALGFQALVAEVEPVSKLPFWSLRRDPREPETVL